MHLILSLKYFTAWFRVSERLIQKQNIISSRLNESISIGDRFIKSGTRIRITCRIAEDRLGITTNLNSDTTEAIILNSQIKEIFVEH